MSNPTPTQDDPADKLAKEIIARMCNAANAFLRPTMPPPRQENPLAGFRLPYAPLAAEIRKYATLMGGDTGDIHAAQEAWFGKDMAPAPIVAGDSTVTLVEKFEHPLVAGTLSNAPEQSFDEFVLPILETEKIRVADLAARMGITVEEAKAEIEKSEKLTITGPGWVKKV